MNTSTNGLVTWGAVLTAIGVLLFAVVLYPRPGSLQRAAPPAQASAAVHGGAPAANAAVSAPARQGRDAQAPPYNPSPVVDLAFTMDDRQVIELAPSTYYEAWTFNGTVPGPVVRVRQGATINVTLTNQGRLQH